MTMDPSHAPPAPAPTPSAGADAPPRSPAGLDGSASPGPLEALYDLNLPVSIELGRTRMTVEEVLGLGRGSIVQLERLVGEPVDVYISERHFAVGEVVVLGEQFGVRITQITRAARSEDA